MIGTALEPFAPPTKGMGDFGRHLQRNHFVFIPGATLSTLLALSGDEVADFGSYWERLTCDQYMGDGGTYRYRRYGEFEMFSGCERRQLPHGPYEQPKYINALNGGVARKFDPLEPDFASHTVLSRLLDWLAQLYDQCEGKACRWNVRVHPYRITASGSEPGQPTPEGLHRDGVDYIVSLLVDRHNVQGGETTITDERREILWQRTLLQPMDIMVGDDHRTMHSVSPVVPAVPGKPAFRDVLVVAFTRKYV